MVKRVMAIWIVSTENGSSQFEKKIEETKWDFKAPFGPAFFSFLFS
jgi:hypothetical protein